MQQFVRFGGMLLLYLAAPVLAVACLVIFVQQAWRFIWGARGVFEEKHLHPAFVFLLGVACVMFTYTADVSVTGDWRRLPGQVAELLDVEPEKGALLLRRQLQAAGAQPRSPVASPSVAPPPSPTVGPESLRSEP